MWECGRFHSALHFGHCLLQAAWFCIHLQAELAAEAQAGSLQQQHVLDCRGQHCSQGAWSPAQVGLPGAAGRQMSSAPHWDQAEAAVGVRMGTELGARSLPQLEVCTVPTER